VGKWRTRGLPCTHMGQTDERTNGTTGQPKNIIPSPTLSSRESIKKSREQLTNPCSHGKWSLTYNVLCFYRRWIRKFQRHLLLILQTRWDRGQSVLSAVRAGSGAECADTRSPQCAVVQSNCPAPAQCELPIADPSHLLRILINNASITS